MKIFVASIFDGCEVEIKLFFTRESAENQIVKWFNEYRVKYESNQEEFNYQSYSEIMKRVEDNPDEDEEVYWLGGSYTFFWNIEEKEVQ